MCNETYETMFPNEELSYFPENNVEVLFIFASNFYTVSLLFINIIVYLIQLERLHLYIMFQSK